MTEPRKRSDRERAGFRGAVKTHSDQWSRTEFSRGGAILRWRGNIVAGSISNRQYVYDDLGRILSIRGDGADHTDSFEYDELGHKKRVRTVPPRPERGQIAISVNIIFESTEEGDGLSEGGSVVTVFNEWDEPEESIIRDPEDHLLSRIVHEYGTNGKLIKDVLEREASEFNFPKSFRDQIPPEQREAVFARVREQMKGAGHFQNVERHYSYNEQGLLAERRLQMVGYSRTTSYFYNQIGDVSHMAISTNRNNVGPEHSPDQSIEIKHSYVYDRNGNWTEQRTHSCVTSEDGLESSYVHRREITYYD